MLAFRGKGMPACHPWGWQAGVIEDAPEVPKSHGREDERPQIRARDLEPGGDPEPHIQARSTSARAAPKPRVSGPTLAAQRPSVVAFGIYQKCGRAAVGTLVPVAVRRRDVGSCLSGVGAAVAAKGPLW